MAADRSIANCRRPRYAHFGALIPRCTPTVLRPPFQLRPFQARSKEVSLWLLFQSEIEPASHSSPNDGGADPGHEAVSRRVKGVTDTFLQISAQAGDAEWVCIAVSRISRCYHSALDMAKSSFRQLALKPFNGSSPLDSNASGICSGVKLGCR